MCLQVQGDEVKCNFGARRRKPFSFDLDSYVDQLRFEEQFNKIKSKPVKLQSMYDLVKDYLTVMAYSDTLQTLEQEYGTASEGDSPTFLIRPTQEETKQSPTLKRKMTID